MGCMCMECLFTQYVRDNHDDVAAICACRESENYMKRVSIAFDSCDSGIIEDFGEEEGSG